MEEKEGKQTDEQKPTVNTDSPDRAKQPLAEAVHSKLRPVGVTKRGIRRGHSR